MNSSVRRRRLGSSIIETLVGTMFFIPIGLFAINLVTIITTNQMNDHLAKDAARAAANQLDAGKAATAAEKTLANFQTSAIVSKIRLESVKYDDKVSGQVKVMTSMDVSFPAPFPGFSKQKFVAQSIEPIVATPAAL